MKKSETSSKNKKFFEFKSRPLLREGSTIYYGDIRDKYVVRLTILDSEKVKDLEVAKKIHLEMMETSNKIDGSQKILKISDRNGLYPALDLADAWLERA